MIFRVIITPQADDDLRAAYRYIRKHAPGAAGTWIKGIRRKIKTLARYPERAPLAWESASFQEPIRELFYGSGNRGTYRILFIIADKNVFVLHVRHGSRLPVQPED
jgi:plasmid stabilization system protein ParE